MQVSDVPLAHPARSPAEAGVRLLRALVRSELKPIDIDMKVDAYPGQAGDAEDPRNRGAQLLLAERDVPLPHLGAAPLFVRSFYAPCVAGPMADLDPGCTAHCRRFVILGNPGSESPARPPVRSCAPLADLALSRRSRPPPFPRACMACSPLQLASLPLVCTCCVTHCGSGQPAASSTPATGR